MIVDGLNSRYGIRSPVGNSKSLPGFFSGKTGYKNRFFSFHTFFEIS